LWEVDARVTRMFFATFYWNLLTPENKLTALVTDQYATHKEFPAQRDWEQI